MGRESSRQRLDLIARSLGCPVLGLDSTSRQDFRACVAEASRSFRSLLVAGGDGTFADVINSLQGEVVLGFLPLGSGNALDFALGRPRSVRAYLTKVLNQDWTRVSVMLCNGCRKSLFASLGIDALTVKKNNELSLFQHNSFFKYALSLAAALGSFEPGQIEVRSPGLVRQFSGNLATIIAKHPFYGYGLRVSRGAALTDPHLCLRVVNSPRLAAPALLAAAALKRRPAGGFFGRAKRFEIISAKEEWLQCDGDLAGRGKEFVFEVLPDHLKLIM